MSTSSLHPIVVGVAGDGTGEAALDWATEAARRTGSPLLIVHASELESQASRMVGAEMLNVEAVMRAEEEAVAAVRERASRLEAEQDLEVRSSTDGTSPVEALLEHQDEAAMIVVGTGRKGAVEEFLLGSTSLGVAAHAHCPVVVINPDVDVARLRHDRLGVAVDGSADSGHAAELAMQLADTLGAKVTAMSTWYIETQDGFVITEPGTPEWDRVERERLAVLERAMQPGREAHPDVEVELVVRRGPVVPTLNEEARGWGAIVVGSRGLGGLRGRLLGSVSQRLMRTAPCPVIITRAPRTERAERHGRRRRR